MFSKPKDSAAPISAAAAPAAAPKRSTRGTVPSIISADLIVTGTLVSNGDIQIDGVVEGDVRSAGLVIGEKAEIRGEILAEDITVRGRVIGRIRARKVQLAATSHVEGDILHEAFAVEAGAFFEGNIRHSDNPLGDEIRTQPVHAAPTAPLNNAPLNNTPGGNAPINNSYAPMNTAPYQPSPIQQPQQQRTGLAGLTPMMPSPAE